MQKSLLLIATVVAFLPSAAHSQPAKQTVAKSSSASYTFESDPRAEIRAVAAAIKTALKNYKDAGNDSSARMRALELLFTFSQSDNLARALAPQAAVSQILNSAQAQAAAASALDSARPDKQAAAPGNSASSTQLVEKAGATSLIALAVDSGALARTQSGTSTTLTGNLYGMYAAFAVPSDVLCTTETSKGSCGRFGKFVRDTSVSATFDLAQSSTKTTTATQPATDTGTIPPGTPVTVPSSVGKLSSISAKFAFLNRFNPTSTSFKTRWSNAVDAYASQINAATDQYLTATKRFADDLLTGGGPGPAEEALLKVLDADAQHLLQLPDKEQAGANKRFADDLDAYYQAAIQAAIKKDSSFYDATTALVSASNTLRLVNNEVVVQALGNMLSVEYDYVRSPQQPEMHNFIFIWGNAPTSSASAKNGDTPSLFSANLGISLYGGAIPAGAKYGRLHDGQAAAEFDFPFALNSSSKNAIFTVASYWQYQPSASVLTITQSDVAPGTTIPAPTPILVGTAGNLYVAQAKISLKGGKSGISVPLGLKWSNKTDLLSGSKYAGQFGINYDFSSLSSLFGSNGQSQ